MPGAAKNDYSGATVGQQKAPEFYKNSVSAGNSQKWTAKNENCVLARTPPVRTSSESTTGPLEL
jgi:hypothetical protein